MLETLYLEHSTFSSPVNANVSSPLGTSCQDFANSGWQGPLLQTCRQLHLEVPERCVCVTLR